MLVYLGVGGDKESKDIEEKFLLVRVLAILGAGSTRIHS